MSVTLSRYDKYPAATYLTDNDKHILLHSRFFYWDDNSPVFKYGCVVATYTYSSGAFDQHASGDPGTRTSPNPGLTCSYFSFDVVQWTERKYDGTEQHHFEEVRRDTNSIYVHDRSRGYTIRLPIHGGTSALSADGEHTWMPLYAIECD